GVWPRPADGGQSDVAEGGNRPRSRHDVRQAVRPAIPDGLFPPTLPTELPPRLGSGLRPVRRSRPPGRPRPAPDRTGSTAQARLALRPRVADRRAKIQRAPRGLAMRPAAAIGGRPRATPQRGGPPPRRPRRGR